MANDQQLPRAECCSGDAKANAKADPGHNTAAYYADTGPDNSETIDAHSNGDTGADTEADLDSYSCRNSFGITSNGRVGYRTESRRRLGARRRLGRCLEAV